MYAAYLLDILIYERCVKLDKKETNRNNTFEFFLLRYNEI